MVKKKDESTEMPVSEIIQLFSSGLSIEALTKRIALLEGISKEKARRRAMDVIYHHKITERKTEGVTNG